MDLADLLFRDYGAARSAGFFPPDFGILRSVQHFGQFLLNLAQAIGAEFEGRLVHFAVHRLS